MIWCKRGTCKVESAFFWRPFKASHRSTCIPQDPVPSASLSRWRQAAGFETQVHSESCHGRQQQETSAWLSLQQACSSRSALLGCSCHFSYLYRWSSLQRPSRKVGLSTAPRDILGRSIVLNKKLENFALSPPPPPKSQATKPSKIWFLAHLSNVSSIFLCTY